MMQKGKSITLQNVFYHTRDYTKKSSVCEAECYVCGKGLADGYPVTAKPLPNGIVMFCDIHYSLQ